MARRHANINHDLGKAPKRILKEKKKEIADFYLV